ncbi:interleukin-6 receptor subunit beta [Enoplosus armatus]|uniref:interleukin-6 receptor subunit beta n=1 Tax=Enoplosus armatus TaxID=215367 RepID=UPI0039915B7A
MDTWSPELLLAAWTVMNLLCVFCHEVTVKDSDLKLCKEDERVCVTDLRDCGPRPPSSIQKTLNMSCYYQVSHRSMTCEWRQESNRHTESDVSLIFSSGVKVLFCHGIFSPATVLNITARMKNYVMGREIWSQPHAVFLYDAVRPSQPLLTAVSSSEDSVVVSWGSSSDGSCRLRYRVDHAHAWTQVPDSVPARRDQNLTYTIKDLLPFTVYRAAVACRGESRIWSRWSSDVSARTLDRVPSRPPEVCYRVERTDSGGSFLLHLMWKDLDLRDAGGRILGYQVRYEPVKKQRGFIQNVTEVTALLVVKEGNCSVTVSAFNAAGFGPAARLSMDPLRQSTLPAVRNLWVSSSFPAEKILRVQWEKPASVLPVSHFAVQWRSETRPSSGRWTTEDGFTNSTDIQDVDPDESYLITVVPVYNQQCGSPQSLSASLQRGALMEAVGLKVVGVTKTTVTVVWAWQKKSGPIRVKGYSVMLEKDSQRQTLSVFPDQWQHKLLNLKPDTEYSLLLLADNASINKIPVRTDYDEGRVAATATPLLLLAVTVFIFSILSRTVYKSYFFRPISSPRASATGLWLMDPNHQRTAERNILDIKDFQVTDIVGEKSVITVGPQPSSEEDVHEDASLLSIGHLIRLSVLELDTEYVSDAAVTAEPRSSYHPDYTVNCRHPDRVFIPEESPEADTREANGWFPQREEERRQMTCEYVRNSSFLQETDVETLQVL